MDVPRDESKWKAQLGLKHIEPEVKVAERDISAPQRDLRKITYQRQRTIVLFLKHEHHQANLGLFRLNILDVSFDVTQNDRSDVGLQFEHGDGIQLFFLSDHRSMVVLAAYWTQDRLMRNQDLLCQRQFLFIASFTYFREILTFVFVSICKDC